MILCSVHQPLVFSMVSEVLVLAGVSWVEDEIEKLVES